MEQSVKQTNRTRWALTALIVVVVLIVLSLIGIYSYHQGWLGWQNEPEEKVELGEKQPIAEDPTGTYFKDNLYVYYTSRDTVCTPFVGCSQGEYYFKIKGARADTFKIVGVTSPSSMFAGADYVVAVDDDRVYYDGRAVENSAPGSLEMRDGYATDQINIYLRGQVVTDLDIPTFKMDGKMFVSDKNGVYLLQFEEGPKKVPLIDRESFKVYESNASDKFAEDKYHYFDSYGGFLHVSGAKPNNQHYQDLNCRYFAFRSKVYYGLFEVPEADLGSFRTFEGADPIPGECSYPNYAIDKNNRYSNGQVVDGDNRQANDEIDLLLKSREEQLAASKKSELICELDLEKNEYSPFKFSKTRESNPKQGVKIINYSDMYFAEVYLSNQSNWTKVGEIEKYFTSSVGCEMVGLERYRDAEDEENFAYRRDKTAYAFRVDQDSANSLFVILDADWRPVVSFNKSEFNELLVDIFGDRRLSQEYLPGNTVIGSSSYLRDRYFLNREGNVEFWIPMGSLDVGFELRDNQLICLDESLCQEYEIGLKTDVGDSLVIH